MTGKFNSTHFAPELRIPNGTSNTNFYTNFGVIEHFCLRNDDGRIHVAELEIDGGVFIYTKLYVGLRLMSL